MIELQDVNHKFIIGKKGNERVVPVLHHINLKVNRGEIVSIVGRSGSGKSTLLNLISGYIRPSSGEIVVDGVPVTKFSEGEWADFRLRRFGFIFQSFQLIPSMTAFENMALPAVLSGMTERDRKQKTEAMMERLGIADYAGFYPGELSGGQQQRVSVGRALLLEPPIILADEPTGSLDSENEQNLLELILELNRESGITFLMITHDDKVASIGHRQISLVDGRINEGGVQHAHA